MPRAAVLVFFAALATVGVAVHGDCGIGWDEMAMRYIGTTTLDHLCGHDAAWPLPPEIRFHGAVVEVALAAAERVLGSTDLRDVFLFRHLAGFLMLLAGAALFYRLARSHFGSRGLALLATAILVLAPRIFGDSFVNTKDIPAMSAWIATMLTLVRLLDRPTAARAAAHAATSALLMAVRAPGILAVAMTVAALQVMALDRRSRGQSAAPPLRALVVYVPTVATLTVALWPYLWTTPLAHLREALATMSRIPWDVPVRYLGADFPASQLPWHYAPIWIAITTPLPVLACLLVGLARLPGVFLRPDEDPRRRRHLGLFAVWLLAPIGAVMALGSTIYDGWRHLYFVWPAAALLATEGARLIAVAAAPPLRRFDRRTRVAAAVAATATLLGPAAAFMLRWHPFESVYFSLPASVVRGRFELDYWGLSYRQALEALLARDHTAVIRYAAPNDPAWDNLAILRPEQRRRLSPQTNLDGARYYLTNFRGEHDDEPPGRPELAIVVDGLTILGAYRLPERIPSDGGAATPAAVPRRAQPWRVGTPSRL